MCEYNIHVEVPHATPTQVWDFMADFSNMRLLNPLLVNWRISGETNDFRKQVRPVGMLAGWIVGQWGIWLIRIKGTVTPKSFIPQYDQKRFIVYCKSEKNGQNHQISTKG